MQAVQRGMLFRIFAVFLLHSVQLLPGADPKWIKVQSDHFEMYTSAGERSARDSVKFFERVRNFFTLITTTKLPEKRVRIVSFGSNKEYEPYRPNESAIAFYHGGPDRDYIVMGRTGDDAQAVAVHEYSHLLAKYSELEIPLWLNEGMAELYSTLKPVADSIQIGDLIPGRLELLRQEKFMPLADLTKVDFDSPAYNEKNRTGLFYAESWALTHMLFLNERYRPNAAKFFVETVKGVPAADAFPKIYNKSIEDVQKDLRSYVNSDRFMSALLPIKLAKADDDLVVAPADDFERRMVLAELQGGTRKHEGALKIYEELVKEYPDRAAVHEALGYYYLYHANREGAKVSFAEAVRMKTENAKLCYDYALLMQEADKPPSEVIPLFERAIQLKYDYPEARLYLGLLLVDQEQYDKALLAFAPIQRLEKAEQAVWLYRAQAYARLRKGDREQAQIALNLAKKYAESPEEKDSITRLQEAIDWSDKEVKQVAIAQLDESRPQLSRAVDEAVQQEERRTDLVDQGPKTERVTGVLDQFDCLGARAKIKVLVDGAEKAFVITDPAEVVILGGNSGAFEFTCGKQKAQTLTIDYDAREDAELGTLGVVRMIQLE